MPKRPTQLGVKGIAALGEICPPTLLLGRFIWNWGGAGNLSGNGQSSAAEGRRSQFVMLASRASYYGPNAVFELLSLEVCFSVRSLGSSTLCFHSPALSNVICYERFD
jgi:hypothetical protein